MKKLSGANALPTGVAEGLVNDRAFGPSIVAAV
jgi:hypothetical protein